MVKIVVFGVKPGIDLEFSMVYSSTKTHIDPPENIVIEVDRENDGTEQETSWDLKNDEFYEGCSPGGGGREHVEGKVVFFMEQ